MLCFGGLSKAFLALAGHPSSRNPPGRARREEAPFLANGSEQERVRRTIQPTIPFKSELPVDWLKVGVGGAVWLSKAFQCEAQLFGNCLCWELPVATCFNATSKRWGVNSDAAWILFEFVVVQSVYQRRLPLSWLNILCNRVLLRRTT